jgi:hypothetical protein
MIIRAQPASSAKVGLASLEEPGDNVRTSSLRVHDYPVRREESISQGDVAALQNTVDLAEQAEFAGFFTLIGAYSGLQNCSHRQADHQERLRAIGKPSPGF